jgi:hypothetical protein
MNQARLAHQMPLSGILPHCIAVPILTQLTREPEESPHPDTGTPEGTPV